MKDLLLELSAHIRANTTLNGLTSGRIYTDRLPERKDPTALVMWIVSESPWNHLEGQVGVDQATVQFDAYGPNRKKSNEIAWELKEFLDGLQGVFLGTVFVNAITRESGISHGTDRPPDGGANYRFIASQDLTVTYASN